MSAHLDFDLHREPALYVSQFLDTSVPFWSCKSTEDAQDLYDVLFGVATAAAVPALAHVSCSALSINMGHVKCLSSPVTTSYLYCGHQVTE